MLGQRLWTACSGCLIALCLLFLIPAHAAAQPTTGACCLPNNTCVQLDFCPCAAQGGAYQGTGSVCTASTCNNVVFGACCSPSNCIISAVSNCPNIGSVWFPNQTCSAVNCPFNLIPEACCCPNSSVCTFMDAFFCGRIGGTPGGPGSTCTPTNPCATPAGVCCDQLGNCTPWIPGTPCNGTILSATSCQPNPCPVPVTQVCCDQLGNCTPFVASTVCNGQVFSGTTCTPNPCPPASHVCCDTTTGLCSPISAAGTCPPGSIPVNGTCTPNPCNPLGRVCCDPVTGNCTIVPPLTGCPTGWLVFTGQVCVPNPCPPAAQVCCDAAGNCTPGVAGTTCQGTIITGTACTPNPCPVTGCCDPATGICQLIAPCPATWQQVTSCNPNPCPQPAQLCCDVNGNCFPILPGTQCNGTIITSASGCNPNPCVPTPQGACCAACGGGCSIVPQSQCPNTSLFFPNQPCSPNICPQQPVFGACCLNNNCIIASSCDCIFKGGTWLGQQPCLSALCAQEVQGACCNPSTFVCTITTSGTCQQLGHVFSANTSCAAAFPNCSKQAPACCCCGSCRNLDQTTCALAGGISVPNQTCTSSAFVCNPNGGACCDPSTGLCFIAANASQCVDPTGIALLFYPGQTCAQIPPCTPPGGVCCDVITGACFVAPPSQCPAPLFVFLLNGSCTPNPCQPTGGACCDPASGNCFPVPSATACNGLFLGIGTTCAGVTCFPPFVICCNLSTGNCFTFSGTQCPTGSFQSTAASCTPINPCPPVGPCCVQGPALPLCIITTQANCVNQGGLWGPVGGSCQPNPCFKACCNLQTGACFFVIGTQPCPTNAQVLIGQTCNPNPCPQPPVVCCNTSTGACTTTTTNCPTGFLPLAGFSSCTPTNPCPPVGPCCTINAAGVVGCIITTQNNCVNTLGGIWGPAGGSCQPSPCLGACCNLQNGGCTITAQVLCPAPNLWVSGGSCNPSSCPGACCNPATGACNIVAQNLCTAPRIFLGVGVPCPTTLCTPGGCCNGTFGSCFIATSPQACQAAGFGNIWLGVGSTCNPNPCLGACCLPNGQCIITSFANCGGTIGGSIGYWLGAGSTCTPVSCRGSCCTANGCIITNPNNCTNGSWGGPGTFCTPNPCPGACCTWNGTCVITLQANCQGFGSSWRGAGVTCTPNPCRGACCKPPIFGGLGSVCVSTTWIGCLLQNGQWQGYGTTCQTPPGSGNFVTCCKANKDMVGGLTINDLFSFLNAWFNNCQGQPGSPCFGMTADFDNNGILNFNDIFAFLNAWFAGCS